MNKVVPFQFESYSVRSITIDGEPLFVLADISDEMTNPKPDLGLRKDQILVNESGLYSVILRSDKPEAKRFKRWITHEVLPALRRTGRYAMAGSADYVTRSELETLIRDQFIPRPPSNLAYQIVFDQSGVPQFKPVMLPLEQGSTVKDVTLPKQDPRQKAMQSIAQYNERVREAILRRLEVAGPKGFSLGVLFNAKPLRHLCFNERNQFIEQLISCGHIKQQYQQGTSGRVYTRLYRSLH